MSNIDFSYSPLCSKTNYHKIVLFYSLLIIYREIETLFNKDNVDCVKIFTTKMLNNLYTYL